MRARTGRGAARGKAVKRRGKTGDGAPAFYDRHGVLGEIEERPVAFALDEELRRRIRGGECTRRLENVSIKLDPMHVVALCKIATMKAIPYQTLIRHWLAEGIRRELHIAVR